MSSSLRPRPVPLSGVSGSTSGLGTAGPLVRRRPYRAGSTRLRIGRGFRITPARRRLVAIPYVVFFAAIRTEVDDEVFRTGWRHRRGRCTCHVGAASGSAWPVCCLAARLTGCGARCAQPVAASAGRPFAHRRWIRRALDAPRRAKPFLPSMHLMGENRAGRQSVNDAASQLAGLRCHA